MKVEISREHHRKYAELVKRWGVQITDREVFGLTREQMAAKIAEDRYLNNVATLRRWDVFGCHLVGRKHTLNANGRDDGLARGCSMAEAVCTMKHAVTFGWVGAEPEWEVCRRCEDGGICWECGMSECVCETAPDDGCPCCGHQRGDTEEVQRAEA